MTKSTLENEAMKFCAFQFCFDREERVRRQIPFLCFWLKELPLQPAVTMQYCALGFFFFTLNFFFDSCALDCRNCTAGHLEFPKSHSKKKFFFSIFIFFSCAFHVSSVDLVGIPQWTNTAIFVLCFKLPFSHTGSFGKVGSTERKKGQHNNL